MAKVKNDDGSHVVAESDQLQKAVNVLLHLALEKKPCETACTHQLTAHWTALGVANVVARTQRRIEREKKNLDDIEATLREARG